jgi:hypothetical protein
LQNSIVTVLIISVMGMALLILALAFFYGLLTLMASAIRDRRSVSVASVESDGGPTEDEATLEVAAIAVALARAGAERAAEPSIGSVLAQPAAAPGVSAWWALHHQRQLAPAPHRRRAE